MSEHDDAPTALDLKVQGILNSIQKSLRPNEEDQEQKTLVEAIQAHRALIVEVATTAYVARSHDPKMLEALSSLLSQLEKSVRDDRKEKAKLQDQQDNKLAFRQVVDALNNLTTGSIPLPDFGGGFNFDPLNTEDYADEFKIKEGELSVGHINLDFDGNSIK